MIRENQKLFNRIQVIIDLVILYMALILAYYIRFDNYAGEHLTLPYYIKTLYFLIPLYFLLYLFFGLYEPQRKKEITNQVSSIIKVNLIGITILLSALFLIKEVNYSRQVFLIFIMLNSTFLVLQRIILRKVLRDVRRRGFNKKYVLIIGAGSLTKRVIKKAKENLSLGYEIVGVVDDLLEKGRTINGIKIIARVNELEEIIEKYLIDEIIIALPLREYDKLKTIIKQCEKSGVRTSIIPDYTKYIPARPQYDELDGIPLLNIRYVPLDNFFYATTKRAFDIILSCIGLIVCSPILFLVAITIKVESQGPILFKQERVGLNKKNFIMYKFRSMKQQPESTSDTQWTTETDPRKTKFGSFIRKTSIDELPQLINVLIGDMSLIGPRPERPFFVDRFREKIPKYMIKHQVRPGITGWAQVNGWRGDTSIRKRIEYDLYYIENWTFTLDIKILVMTVFKGFVNKNAY